MTINEKKEALRKAVGESWGQMFVDFEWEEVKEKTNTFLWGKTIGPYISTAFLPLPRRGH